MELGRFHLCGRALRALSRNAVPRMPRRGGIHDPKHWYDRAAEMRALAESFEDAETRKLMLQLADDYDKLADRAALRRARKLDPEK